MRHFYHGQVWGTSVFLHTKKKHWSHREASTGGRSSRLLYDEDKKIPLPKNHCWLFSFIHILMLELLSCECSISTRYKLLRRESLAEQWLRQNVQRWCMEVPPSCQHHLAALYIDIYWAKRYHSVLPQRFEGLHQRILIDSVGEGSVILDPIQGNDKAGHIGKAFWGRI